MFLVLLIAFASIGIDIAKLAAAQEQLQAAADAAALAGAAEVDSLTGHIIQAQAVNRAIEAGGLNKAFQNEPTPVVIDPTKILFPNDTTIQVTTERLQSAGTGVVTHIAQVLGVTRLDMRAKAVAEVVKPNCVRDLVPMAAIPPPGASGFPTGCGSSVDLNFGPPPVYPGNFGFVDLPDCNEGPCAGMNSTGANTLRCLIDNGYGCCVPINGTLISEPGAKAGPFRQALNDRFDSDSDTRTGPGVCYENYTGNGRRVVTVPITTALPNGRGPVTVIGFAQFFLLDRVTASIAHGEFINDVVPGEGSGGTGTAVSVRLVK